MGNFYRVPADNRGLNYDKFFKEGETERNTLTEFNSDNTTRLNLEETKHKIASLEYIQKELAGVGNFVQKRVKVSVRTGVCTCIEVQYLRTLQ